METPQVGVGSVVRCISTNGVDPASSHYAIVVSVAAPHEDLVGSKGEPALSLVSLNPDVASKRGNKLGTSEWFTEFKRESGILHTSHPDVIDGKVSTFWVDALPTLPDVDPDDLKEHLLYATGNPQAPAEPIAPVAPIEPEAVAPVEPVAPIEEPIVEEPVVEEPIEPEPEPEAAEEPIAEEPQEAPSTEEHVQS